MIVAVRTTALRVSRADGELEVLRNAVRPPRGAHPAPRPAVNRCQRLLSELVPGYANEDLVALQAKAVLASVRPRDIAGKRKTPPRVDPRTSVDNKVEPE